MSCFSSFLFIGDFLLFRLVTCSLLFIVVPIKTKLVIRIKHLFTDCAFNAEKYSGHSSDVRTERSDNHMKFKVSWMNW